ncbi:urea transporter [Streptomyces sp. NPDC004561]
MRWRHRGHIHGITRQVLRGTAQVMLVPDAWAGAFFCLALATADWRYSAYALAGAALGTGTARLLDVSGERVEPGLEGLNSCLLALSFAAFLDPDRLSTMLLAAAGCPVVTVVTAALVHLLRVWNLPPLTLPYCVLAGAVTGAAPAFHRIRPPGDGVVPSGTAALHPYDVGRAFFRGVSQIFFLDQWYVGALLLAGLFLADRVAGLVACAGSATGILTAWALGAPAARITDGTMGYNAVLVALALCGAFLPAGPATLLYGLLGAATATAVTPALARLLTLSGGHVLTWPFVLTTLGFLAAARSFPRLTARTVTPDGALRGQTTAWTRSA